MFRSITFNGTDKKAIGVPIIKKTNKMIYEFDLQYERNYKMTKVISRREKEFKEYLKKQEELEFRKENLIKLLKGYFLENNYNSDTFYSIYKHPIIPSIKKRKRKKRVWPKTARIRRNKNLFYKITKNYYYFNKFNPYLFPLTIKERKKFERKIITDPNLKSKNENFNNMTIAQLKKYVDVFGFIPLVFKTKEEKKIKNKKNKNGRNFTANIFMGKKISNSLKLKREASAKFVKFRNNYNNNNFNSYNNISNNYSIKGNDSLSFKNNKKIVYNNKLNRYDFISNKMENNLSKINHNSNSFNNFQYNIRYLNIINYNKKNYSNFSSINSPNKSLLNSTNNNIINKNNNYVPSSIRLKKHINIGNFKRHTSKLKKKCIKTIKKSEILEKDIIFFNKINKLSSDDFKNKKYQIQKKGLKVINYMNYMKIYEKDFKPDVKKELEKKYQYIKEDLKGHIQLNDLDFLRKQKSRLNFVRVYNRRRDLKKLIREDYILNDNEVDKKNKILNIKKSISSANIKESKNNFKNITSSVSIN